MKPAIKLNHVIEEPRNFPALVSRRTDWARLALTFWLLSVGIVATFVVSLGLVGGIDMMVQLIMGEPAVPASVFNRMSCW